MIIKGMRAVGLVLLIGLGGAAPAPAQTGGEVPGGTHGAAAPSELWRQMRQGDAFQVSIPDQKAAVMIQSEGDNWRAWRNGPVSTYGGYALGGILVLLAGFFLLRGRIRIDGGRSGRTVRRFTLIERVGHWLTAVSFILLALTGLNILYGRYLLKPLLGPEAFAGLAAVGKYIHHYSAFAFMAGLVLIFLMWVRHNLPDRYDLGWIARGGGLLRKGVHPPAGKFNFGQKLIFWAVVLGGVAVSFTGLNLMFPFEWAGLQQLQTMQLAHAIAALALTVIIIAHIYIGSLGMEGAFSAMGSGLVDENWAREHHSAWVVELERKRRGQQPAE